MTDTTFTPVAGSGYDTQTVNRNSTDMQVEFVTVGLDSYWRVLTKIISFNATGNWTVAKHVVIRGNSTGSFYLIGFGSLSVPRELKIGDRLDVSLLIKPKI